MILSIDPRVCVGSGNCVVRLPRNCAIDQGATIGHVVDPYVSPDDEREAHRAVAMCPVSALTLHAAEPVGGT